MSSNEVGKKRNTCLPCCQILRRGTSQHGRNKFRHPLQIINKFAETTKMGDSQFSGGSIATLVLETREPRDPREPGADPPSRAGPERGEPRGEPRGDPKPLRQLREPKTPLYVPAVLRSTFSLTSPDLSPDLSLSNTPAKSKASNVSRNPVNAIPKDSNSDRSKEPLASTIFSSPTRSHWKPDSSSTSCSLCYKPFTWLERRHHCRRCGLIFCSEHVENYIQLDYNAEFLKDEESNGSLQKVCDSCFDDYRIFRENSYNISNHSKEISQNDLSIQLDNDAEENKDKVGDLISTKKKRGIINGNGNGNGNENENENENLNENQEGKNLDPVIGSVPADWSWSSF